MSSLKRQGPLLRRSTRRDLLRTTRRRLRASHIQWSVIRTPLYLPARMAWPECMKMTKH
jgi:hypothetical protein